MTSDVRLRPLAPTDGNLIARLREESPDTGRVGAATYFVHDPYETLVNLHPGTIGVVAEVPEYDGLVGSGLLRFGQANYEGAVRPFAYLYGLSVHPDFRRRGIASALANWRVDKARERSGADTVIYAGIQASNQGSFSTAKRWMRQRFDRMTMGVFSVRGSPPVPVHGLEVRPAAPADYEQIVEKQNHFYRNFNLYSPQTADDFAAWQEHKLFGITVHRYYVVVSPDGHILGGIGLLLEGQLVPTKLIRIPMVLQVINKLAHVVPADRIMKRSPVKNFWYENEDAGRYLWELARWLGREFGTNLTFSHDSNGSFNEILRYTPLTIKASGSIVITGPVEMAELKPIYFDV